MNTLGHAVEGFGQHRKFAAFAGLRQRPSRQVTGPKLQRCLRQAVQRPGQTARSHADPGQRHQRQQQADQGQRGDASRQALERFVATQVVQQGPTLRSTQLQMAVDHHQLIAGRIPVGQRALEALGHRTTRLESCATRACLHRAGQQLARRVQQQGAALLAGGHLLIPVTGLDDLLRVDNGNQDTDQVAAW